MPLSSSDPAIIRWAADHGRILVARDKSTLPGHLQAFVTAGGHSPGIFLVRDVPLSLVLDFLVCAAYASEPLEWADRVTYIP